MPDTHTETIELDNGIIMDTNELQEWFEELNALRDSGEINMFGAPAWLQDVHGVNRSESRAIFKAWTDQFESYESVHND